VDAAKSDQAKPKCNIEACKQAYFTFTPEDCTYQPSDGPRKLCTK
jgi:penicillin-binding protein 1A